jgi:hypothetical protein
MMPDRRIQPGETSYNPFNGALHPSEAAKLSEPSAPENPREGQLWLMPSDNSAPRFKHDGDRKVLADEINAAIGRSDTLISPMRFTVLQFTSGRWESLV